MDDFLLRSLYPALTVTSPFIALWLVFGLPSLLHVLIIYGLILAYYWYFMEVDLDDIQNIKGSGVEVCVVGAGISGIATAVKLKKAGIPFFILEKSPGIGGTWIDNRYPGCAVDVKSALFHYSFFLNTQFSKVYADRDEIFGYIEKAADYFGIRKYVRQNTYVKTAEWMPEERKWKLDIKDDSGERTLMVTHLISCCGTLRERNYPKYEGMDKFKGRQFHSQDWDTSYDLTNKRVAIVGSAASAVQIGPAIVDKVKSLHVFQRTPNWHFPRHNGEWPNWFKTLQYYIPYITRIMRLMIFLRQELVHLLFFWEDETHWSKEMEMSYMEGYLADQVGGNEHLKKHAIPSFSVGCKRVLVVSDFWPMFTKHSYAHLITDPIDKMNENGILMKNGDQIDVDLIIYATGFKIYESICGFDVVGRNKITLLNHLLEGGGTALFGVSVDNFPNFFIVSGPNAGLVHSSIIFMIECQINRVMTILRQVIENDIEVVEVKSEVLKKFEKMMDRLSANRTYGGKTCESWYKHASGNNRKIWPLSLISFWMMSRKVDIWNDFSTTFKRSWGERQKLAKQNGHVKAK